MKLSEKQKQALAEIAESSERSVEDVISEAIDSYLLKHEGDSFYEAFDIATDFQDIGLSISHDETIAWAKNIEVEGIEVPSATVVPFADETPTPKKQPEQPSQTHQSKVPDEDDYIGDSYLSLEGVQLPEYGKDNQS